MIEPICALIAAAVAAAVAVLAYYRICHAAKFWEICAAGAWTVYEHANREKAVCRYRESIRPSAPRKRRQTVIDNGREYVVEKGGA